jgi:hypothetical protein
MTTSAKVSERNVYKFQSAGRIFYRLGYGCQDARVRLAVELHIDSRTIEILEKGQKQ